MSSQRRFLAILFILAGFGLTLTLPATGDELDALDEYEPLIEQEVAISDPFEPVNRVFFTINDKLYFWVLKPASQVYGAILPEDFRICISNAFYNLMTPVRLVNNLLQGKIEQSGVELARFVINTTAGAAGLGDPAGEVFHLKSRDEDLGQTLGSYGVGDGVYICWPLFGPSNLRDTIGMVGDSFVNPLSQLGYYDGTTGLAVQGVKRVNTISLREGEYEQFKESSFDPYVAMRDFYLQHRRSKVEDRGHTGRNSSQAKAGNDSTGTPADDSPAEPSTALAGIEAKKLDHRRFYVQVGSFDRISTVRQVLDNLIRNDKKPLVVEYDSSDTRMYGVQVPAGTTLAAADFEASTLKSAGFTDTTIIAR